MTDVGINQELLARMAVADAQHDFKDECNEICKINENVCSTDITERVLYGLPITPEIADRIKKNKIDDEISIFNRITQSNYQDLIDYGKNNDEYNTTLNAITGKIYMRSIKLNNRTIDNDIMPKLYGKELHDVILPIGNKNINFIVDCDPVTIMALLKTGNKYNANVNYLYTYEVANDSANKIGNDNAVFVENNKGPTISRIQEITPIITSYNTDTFFSKYNIQLGNNIINFQVQGGVNVNITDTHNNNNITNIGNIVCYDIDRVKKPDHFNRVDNATAYSIAFQQKRSGDWLQALACREEILRSKTFNKGIDFSARTYFVTHDRIALSFAILKGINCIYSHISHDKKKNISNESTRVMYIFENDDIEQFSIVLLKNTATKCMTNIEKYKTILLEIQTEYNKRLTPLIQVDLKSNLTNIVVYFLNDIYSEYDTYINSNYTAISDAITIINDAVEINNDIKIQKNILDDFDIKYNELNVKMNKYNNVKKEIEQLGSPYSYLKFITSTLTDYTYNTQELLEYINREDVNTNPDVKILNTIIYEFINPTITISGSYGEDNIRAYLTQSILYYIPFLFSKGNPIAQLIGELYSPTINNPFNNEIVNYIVSGVNTYVNIYNKNIGIIKSINIGNKTIINNIKDTVKTVYNKIPGYNNINDILVSIEKREKREILLKAYSEYTNIIRYLCLCINVIDVIFKYNNIIENSEYLEKATQIYDSIRIYESRYTMLENIIKTIPNKYNDNYKIDESTVRIINDTLINDEIYSRDVEEIFAFVDNKLETIDVDEFKIVVDLMITNLLEKKVQGKQSKQPTQAKQSKQSKQAKPTVDEEEIKKRKMEEANQNRKKMKEKIIYEKRTSTESVPTPPTTQPLTGYFYNPCSYYVPTYINGVYLINGIPTAISGYSFCNGLFIQLFDNTMLAYNQLTSSYQTAIQGQQGQQGGESLSQEEIIAQLSKNKVLVKHIHIKKHTVKSLEYIHSFLNILKDNILDEGYDSITSFDYPYYVTLYKYINNIITGIIQHGETPVNNYNTLASILSYNFMNGNIIFDYESNFSDDFVEETNRCISYIVEEIDNNINIDIEDITSENKYIYNIGDIYYTEQNYYIYKTGINYSIEYVKNTINGVYDNIVNTYVDAIRDIKLEKTNTYKKLKSIKRVPKSCAGEYAQSEECIGRLQNTRQYLPGMTAGGKIHNRKTQRSKCRKYKKTQKKHEKKRSTNKRTTVKRRRHKRKTQHT